MYANNSPQQQIKQFTSLLRAAHREKDFLPARASTPTNNPYGMKYLHAYTVVDVPYRWKKFAPQLCFETYVYATRPSNRRSQQAWLGQKADDQCYKSELRSIHD
jgi:hypothetical protein